MGIRIWGVVIADTISSVMIQAGLILMKIALVNVEGKTKSGFFSWRWILGFVLVFVASMIHVTLQAFMSIILLSATSVSSIVVGVLLSIFWLKEQFVWQYDLAALALMTGGAASMVLQAGYIPDKFTFDELKNLVKSEKSIIFYVCVGVILILASFSYYLLLVTLKNFEKTVEAYVIGQKLTLPPSQTPENINKTESTFNTRASDSNSVMRASESVMSDEEVPRTYTKPKHCCGKTCERFKLLGPTRSPRVIVELISDLPKSFFKQNFPEYFWLKTLIRTPMVLLLTVAAMLTGLNMATFKVIGEAITSGIPIWSTFVILLTIAGLAQAALQLYLLNLAMKTFKQIDVVPVYESLNIAFTILAGLVLFDESQYYTWGQIMGILAGVLVVIIGIFILSLKHKLQHGKQLKETNLADVLQVEETEEQKLLRLYQTMIAKSLI